MDKSGADVAYVIMGNAFPDSVAFGEDAANAEVARLKAADPACGTPLRVYWRAIRVPVVRGILS